MAWDAPKHGFHKLMCLCIVISSATTERCSKVQFKFDIGQITLEIKIACSFNLYISVNANFFLLNDCDWEMGKFPTSTFNYQRRVHFTGFVKPISKNKISFFSSKCFFEIILIRYIKIQVSSKNTEYKISQTIPRQSFIVVNWWEGFQIKSSMFESGPN